MMPMNEQLTLSSLLLKKQILKKKANSRDLEIKEAFATKGNNFISGLGTSQQIMNFLDGSDEGDISDVLELNSDFVVLEVLEVTPEGYRSLDEVRTQVENLVKIERRKELTAERVQGLLDQYETLEAIAEQTDQEIQSQNNLRANATVIQGAGREPMVIGAVLSLEEGQTSDVLVGNSAAFIVEVISKETADLANLDPQTRNEIRQRLEQQKFQEFNSVWLEQLKEDADIVDNRDRLLR